MRGLVLAASVAVSLMVTACGTSSSSSSRAGSGSGSNASPSTPGAYSGFGAKLADFTAAHPPGGCKACYGQSVTVDGQQTWEFTLLGTSPDNGRVDGFTYTFPNHPTSVANAKGQILGLMPNDTKPVLFKVTHENGSCALWGLRSKTIATWLGGPKEGDAAGDISVTFERDTSDGFVYDPRNITVAVVSITSISASAAASC